jgi:hypothetical protein
MVLVFRDQRWCCGESSSSGEHLGDIDDLHTGSACFGASPEFLGIGGLPLFPRQRRSAALREHDVKHRRTGAARNTLSRIVFRMNGG